MYKAQCSCCGAVQWVKVIHDEPDTGYVECEDPDPDDWVDGCIVIDGLFYFDVLCDHEDFEYVDYDHHTED